MKALAETFGGIPGGQWTPEQEVFLFFSLTLLVLGIFSLGLFFVWLARRHVRNRHLAELAEGAESFPSKWLPQARYQSTLFDGSCRWLAIRSNNPQAVQSALNLHNTTLCSWEEGLAEARERKLFITPPIDEWVLVVGPGLPDPSDDVDHCFHFLSKLSRKMGMVQFYSVDRALHHHAWAQVESGRVIRAYAWADHTLWNQGRPTLAELDLRLKCLDYGQAHSRTDFARIDPMAANAEKITSLAARWSVDPTTIDERQFKTDHGITGEMSQPK